MSLMSYCIYLLLWFLNLVVDLSVRLLLVMFIGLIGVGKSILLWIFVFFNGERYVDYMFLVGVLDDL